MVDATKGMESQYLNADSVKRSKTKKAVILEEGEYQITDYGEGKVERLTIRVDMDGSEKLWRPNKDSVKNLVRETDSINTEGWVGVICELGITTFKGKDSVIVKSVLKFPEATEEVE